MSAFVRRIAVALALLGCRSFGQTKVDGRGPVQPLPFSHKTHVALSLKCSECHPNPEPGEAMTLPSTSKCMFCHVTIAKEKPSIQRLAQYAKTKQEIPWISVNTLPDWVFWSHRTHLEAKQSCETCHGDVRAMDVTAKATDVTTMGGCVSCHQKNSAATGCQTCHENRSP